MFRRLTKEELESLKERKQNVDQFLKYNKKLETALISIVEILKLNLQDKFKIRRINVIIDKIKDLL